MLSQNERLAEYLTTHKTINPLEAWQELGIYRLGARIFDLREKGLKIESKLVTVYNRFGEDCRVSQYELH
jgi:hypothetical protein